ncbi:HDOD domain-containing protein [Nibricoccus sp. IMCC34717]|uniref:HDOD domain-containing protein n=1 Tax=Nibricoccus sp. IMCC34717 TaxID=3034021 RepID=UPI003850B825
MSLPSAIPAHLHGPRSPKGATTIKKVENAMEKGTAHCLPELIELMQSICMKGNDVQVRDLVDIMEKHPALLAKVISAATTLGYNPSRIEITTISHAIQVIGFDRIRSLVTTLMLVRHAKNEEHLREQKEAALCAILSGLASQRISRERKVGESDMAFVAASLRHLGRLLMSTYLRDEYRLVMATLRDSRLSEKDIFRDVFGLTPVELTRAILQKAKFPESLLDTLHEPESNPKRKKRGEENKVTLMDVAVFGERLSDLTMSRRLAQEQFPQKARSLCASFPEDLDFSESEMVSLLGDIGEELGTFTEQMGFGTVASDAVQMCRHRQGKGDMPGTTPPLPATPSDAATATPDVAAPASTADAAPVEAQASAPAPVARATETPVAAATPTAPAAPAAPAQASPAPAAPKPEPLVEAPAPPSTGAPMPVQAEAASTLPIPGPNERLAVDVGVSAWKDGLVNLTSFLHDPSADPMALLDAAAKVVRDGFRSPEFVLLTLDADRTNYTASAGEGKVFHKMRGRVAMKKGERTALALCAMRRENVLIHDTSDPKTAPYIPEWANSAAGWGAFVAVPFHDGNQTFAMVICAWPCLLQLSLSAEQTKLLRSIGSMVAAARKIAA